MVSLGSSVGRKRENSGWSERLSYSSGLSPKGGSRANSRWSEYIVSFQGVERRWSKDRQSSITIDHLQIG
jgi:hypothetical protein